jgi:hypothetical protein
MTLPPKLEEDQEPPPVKERNMLKILVNQQGQVLLEDKPSSVERIRAEVMKHVTNNGQDPNYAEAADKAIVSIKVTRQTPYDVYINVLDEVWMGYRELWDAEARRMGYKAYQDYLDRLGPDAENTIRDRYKPAISIAEPDPGEGEA